MDDPRDFVNRSLSERREPTTVAVYGSHEVAATSARTVCSYPLVPINSDARVVWLSESHTGSRRRSPCPVAKRSRPPAPAVCWSTLGQRVTWRRRAPHVARTRTARSWRDGLALTRRARAIESRPRATTTRERSPGGRAPPPPARASGPAVQTNRSLAGDRSSPPGRSPAPARREPLPRRPRRASTGSSTAQDRKRRRSLEKGGSALSYLTSCPRPRYRVRDRTARRPLVRHPDGAGHRGGLCWSIARLPRSALPHLSARSGRLLGGLVGGLCTK